MGILLQIVAVLLGLIGFFGKIWILFFIAGFLSIFLDLIGFLSGKLNPLLPIFLYVGGYLVTGNWYGVLGGAIIGQSLEAVFILIAMIGGGSYTIIEKIRKR